MSVKKLSLPWSSCPRWVPQAPYAFACLSKSAMCIEELPLCTTVGAEQSVAHDANVNMPLSHPPPPPLLVDPRLDLSQYNTWHISPFSFLPYIPRSLNKRFQRICQINILHVCKQQKDWAPITLSQEVKHRNTKREDETEEKNFWDHEPKLH